MAVNKALRFVRREPGHEDRCSLCDRIRLGRKAAAVEFTPTESMRYAAVYCCTCIASMLRASRSGGEADRG